MDIGKAPQIAAPRRLSPHASGVDDDALRAAKCCARGWIKLDHFLCAEVDPFLIAPRPGSLFITGRRLASGRRRTVAVTSRAPHPQTFANRDICLMIIYDAGTGVSSSEPFVFFAAYLGPNVMRYGQPTKISRYPYKAIFIYKGQGGLGQ